MIADNITGAETCIIREAAHFPNLEAPDLFNTLVHDWLSSRAILRRHLMLLSGFWTEVR